MEFKRIILKLIIPIIALLILFIVSTIQAQRPGGGPNEADINRFLSRMGAASSRSLIKDSWLELTFTIRLKMRGSSKN